MKPLNLDNKPCSPISSNCVVWQGPDIPCIQLCTGDTVSDVVSAMATELCTILDTLKVSNYDLTCFNLQACGPEDFQALIQFLITKICELEGITPETKDIPSCPDCVVSVAECFVTGTQTTMQLVDYVQLIGEKVCSLITEISLIQAQITDILIRVTNLENAPVPTFTIPTVALTECDLSATVTAGASYDIDVLVTALVNDSVNGYCALIGATGLPADLLSAVSSQEPCITELSDTRSNPGTNYGTEYATWVASPLTVADSITNIWLVLCDLYTALASIQTITVADTPTIDLTLSAGNELTADITDTGWVDLEGFTFYSLLDKTKCRRIGNVIHFKGIAFIPLDNSGTAYTLNDVYDLRNITSVLPFTGTGGVSIASDLITWNNGNSSVPASVLNGDVIDDVYRIDAPTIAERPVQIGGGSTRLFSATRVQVNANGSLTLATVDSYESMPATLGLTTLKGSSALRYLTSNIRQNDFVPDFTNVSSDIHSFPVPAAWDVAATYTVGDIVEHNGDFYQSFINVTGGGAPDVTPTSWGPYTSKLDTDFQTGQPVYTFSCNAGDPQELGGFFVILDGLTCFV